MYGVMLNSVVQDQSARVRRAEGQGTRVKLLLGVEKRAWGADRSSSLQASSFDSMGTRTPSRARTVAGSLAKGVNCERR